MGVLLLTKQFKNLFWKCADEINGALFVNWQLVPTLHVVSLDKELNRKKRKTMCLLSCSLLDWAHVYNSNKKENFSCTTRHKTLYNTLLEQWTLKVKALARIFIYDNKVRIIFFWRVKLGTVSEYTFVSLKIFLCYFLWKFFIFSFPDLTKNTMELYTLCFHSIGRSFYFKCDWTFKTCINIQTKYLISHLVSTGHITNPKLHIFSNNFFEYHILFSYVWAS